MKRILTFWLPSLVVTAISICCSSCGSSPTAVGVTAAELSKVEAGKLLTSMGYENVIVATAVNGAAATHVAEDFYTFVAGGPNMACVVAYGERNGRRLKIVENLFYDRELGWMYAEIDKEGRRVRFWTKSGYNQLESGNPPTSPKK